MDYRIVEKNGFKVVGKPLRVSMKHGEQFDRIPQFWTECIENGAVARITSLAAGIEMPPHSTLGICTDFSQATEEFTYFIGAEKPEQNVDNEFVESTIPAATWAVFDAVGALPDSIQSIWKRIWTEFFGVTGYTHADAPEIEVYPRRDGPVETYCCQVWIPVEKRQRLNISEGSN